MIAAAFSACITIVLLFFGHIPFDLFTDTPELIELAASMIGIMTVGYTCISATQVLGGSDSCSGGLSAAHLTKSEAYPDG